MSGAPQMHANFFLIPVYFIQTTKLLNDLTQNQIGPSPLQFCAYMPIISTTIHSHSQKCALLIWSSWHIIIKALNDALLCQSVTFLIHPSCDEYWAVSIF